MIPGNAFLYRNSASSLWIAPGLLSDLLLLRLQCFHQHHRLVRTSSTPRTQWSLLCLSIPIPQALLQSTSWPNTPAQRFPTHRYPMTIPPPLHLPLLLLLPLRSISQNPLMPDQTTKPAMLLPPSRQTIGVHLFQSMTSEQRPHPTDTRSWLPANLFFFSFFFLWLRSYRPPQRKKNQKNT